MRELQYLQNIGNTWANFPLNAGQNYTIEVSYVKLLAEGTSARHTQYIDFGSEYRFWGCSNDGFYTKTPNGDTRYKNDVLEGSTSWSKDGVFINGERLSGPFSSGPSVKSFWLGATNASGGDSYQGINGPDFYGEMKFKNSDGEVVADFVPCLDDTNVVCFYDKIAGQYIYPTSGTYVAGPFAHTFNPDKTSVKFESVGGTDTITVASETSWTATTTDSWLTITQNGDTVTVEAPLYEGDERRKGSIYFEDAEGYSFTVSVSQKSAGAGWSNLFMGEENTTTLYIGEQEIITLYMGEQEVYSSGPFVGLKVTKRIVTTINGGIFTIKGQSSEPWSTTAPEWITLSQTSGDAGKFEIEVTIAETDDDREASIDFTTENYSASCAVEQIKYQALNYIWKSDLVWAIPDNIDTLIPHTSDDMEIRVKFKSAGKSTADRIVGYHQGDNGCKGDSNDFRLFCYYGNNYDYGNQRKNVGGNSFFSYNVEFDLTIGNYWVYDNINNKYQLQEVASSVVPSPNCHILADVSAIKLKSVQIKQGGNIVFDGIAAKVGEQIGLWDLVSNKLVTNPNIDFSFE